jgi:hypothetical protein
VSISLLASSDPKSGRTEYLTFRDEPPHFVGIQFKYFKGITLNKKAKGAGIR